MKVTTAEASAAVEPDTVVAAVPLPTRLRVGIRQALVLLVVTFIALTVYLSVEYWRGAAARIFTNTTWDAAIPFYYGWVWVYLLPYLIAPVVAAMLRPATFDWFIRRGHRRGARVAGDFRGGADDARFGPIGRLWGKG